jgi:transcriptional antiterminator RfaH
VATHPQAERWAEQNVARIGYRTYLPLVAVRKRDRAVRSMWHTVLQPLFPGYLFVVVGRGDPWTPVRYSPGVRSLLVASDGLQHCRPGAVEALQAGEELRRVLQPAGAGWRCGDACRLADGVFAGTDAVVTQLRGSRAVVALVFCGELRQAVVELAGLERR